jgi:hypothetical protein
MLHKIIENVDKASRAVGVVVQAFDLAGGVFVSELLCPGAMRAETNPQANEIGRLYAKCDRINRDRVAAERRERLAIEQCRDAIEKVKGLEEELVKVRGSTTAYPAHTPTPAPKESAFARTVSRMISAEIKVEGAHAEVVLNRGTALERRSACNTEQLVTHVIDAVETFEASVPF